MIIAVGAHSRNVGKTSIICSILRAVPEARWTAVKVSGNRRGVSDGFDCIEELEPRADSDSARYLEAGAERAFWMRAEDRRVEEAAWRIRRLASDGANVIVESNRIVEHLPPTLYLLALDFSVSDFKESARRYFGRADAYCVSRSGLDTPAWGSLGPRPREIELRPIYEIAPPDYRPRGLIRDIRTRLGLRLDRAGVA